MKLSFLRPQEFWMARSEDIAPPDMTDDHRYTDQKPLDWSWVCEVVAQVVAEWDTTQVDDDGDLLFLTPDPPGKAEGSAVRDWGRGVGKSPRTDPGRLLEDGRHRLAGCWGYQPDIILPIRSETLRQVAEIRLEPSEFNSANLRSRCADLLESLGETATLDFTIPANRRWLARLQAAAFGLFVPPGE